MKEVTLEELLAQAERLNETSSSKEIESPVIREKIADMAENIDYIARHSGSVAILTDYDADGICSAYIMQKTLQSMNPDLQTEVVCNDRRASYGVPKFVSPEKDTQYIVLDMGSNELGYIMENFGKDTVVIDHHLTSESARMDFEMNTNLLNPHFLHEDDSLNADYCATGLAYRVFSELSEKYPERFNEETRNTLEIMACIGTVSDVVNLADEHSQNRFIVRQGLDRIHENSEIDQTLRYVLKQCKVLNESTTAKDIGYSVGSFLNSASRMSSEIHENGAMRMYNALTGTNKTEIDNLMEINQQKKDLVKQMQDDRYWTFVQQERFSENRVAVYVTENTPSAFSGLLAGKLTDATDKAIICLAWHDDLQCYTGSGRNIAGQSSLKEFLDRVTETAGLDVVYGGHHDAVGISRLGENDLDKFVDTVKALAPEISREESYEMTVLNISSEELNSRETIEKIQALEPVGEGFRIPPVTVEGQVTNARTLAGNENWESFQVNGTKVIDWSFSEKKYPLDNEGNVKFLAEVGISNFRGEHIELSADWNYGFYQERQQELLAQQELQEEAEYDFHEEKHSVSQSAYEY